MHLQDQVLLSIDIEPLGLLASTSVAMQVEENNLCMVTKNALLQQQNQHLQAGDSDTAAAAPAAAAVILSARGKLWCSLHDAMWRSRSLGFIALIPFSACAYVTSCTHPCCHQMESSTLSLDIICTAAEHFVLLSVVSYVQLVPRVLNCHSFDACVLVQGAKFSDERQTLLATIQRLIAGGPAQNAGVTGMSCSHR